MAVSPDVSAADHSPSGNGSPSVATSGRNSRSNVQATISNPPRVTRSRAPGFAAASVAVSCSQRLRPPSPSATVMLSEASASTSTTPCWRALRLDTIVGRIMQAINAKNAVSRRATSNNRRPPPTRVRSGGTANSTAASARVTSVTKAHDPTGSKPTASSSSHASSLIVSLRRRAATGADRPCRRVVREPAAVRIHPRRSRDHRPSH